MGFVGFIEPKTEIMQHLIGEIISRYQGGKFISICGPIDAWKEQELQNTILKEKYEFLTFQIMRIRRHCKVIYLIDLGNLYSLY